MSTGDAQASDRHRRVLLRKIGAFGQELDHWKTLSQPKGTFEKHRSQIQRLVDQLSPVAKGLREEIANAKPAEVLLQRTHWERQGLSLYRVWEVFRSKLALRSLAWLTGYLATADEFAWECYEPAIKAAQEAGKRPKKEPPLVYLNGGWSPFAVSRGYRYEADAADGEPLSLAAAEKLLERLPVPLIGMPWYSLKSLEELPVLAHEVGHLVEDDFDVAPATDAALTSALEKAGERKSAWLSWRGEIWADFWGVLGAGPWFVGALLDFLTAPRAEIENEEADPRGPYPPVQIRVLLVLKLLSELGYEDEAKQRSAAWLQSFPKHGNAGFERDLGPVCRALREVQIPSFGGKTPQGVLRPPSAQAVAARAEELREDLRKQLEKALSGGSWSTRVAIASVRAAVESKPDTPTGFEERVLALVQKKREKGQRAGEDDDPLLAEADRLAAIELSKLLASETRGPTVEQPAALISSSNEPPA